MTDLPERLPAALSERLAGASGAIFAAMGREVDCAIGGIPFRLATSQELAHTIETIPVRKEQLDTEADPGEQSLTGWWRRSQASFHQGAGFLYETINTNQAFDGFWDSSGVDVWTPGRVTLLRKMEPWGSVGTTLGLSKLRAGTGSDTTAISGVDGGLYRLSPTSGSATLVYDAVTNAGAAAYDGMILPASGSDPLYVVTQNEKLVASTVDSPATDTEWDLDGASARDMAWGKHRLWLIGLNRIWQPDLTLAGGTTQSPIYTNPDTGFIYRCIAEAPSGMLFAGDNGTTSSIQLITLDADGALPTLSGATIVATLPRGELIQDLEVLAGQYVGIATNLGFRVGLLDQNGGITYGPLIIEKPSDLDGFWYGCPSVTSHGRFFYVSTSDNVNSATAYRVDTATQVAEGVYAYAKDVEAPTAPTPAGGFMSLGVVQTHSRVAALADDGSPWIQADTDYVDSGWIQTSRIRFRTTEPKTFKYVDLDIEPLHGAISVDLVLEGGSTLPLGSFTRQGEVVTDPLSADTVPMRYGSLRLTLTPDEDGAAPVIASYLIRALPAVKPQRLITLPLLCFDREKARSGQVYGDDGYALDRVTALQYLEDQAVSLVYQDFTTPGAPSRIVTIESLRFVQTSPPAKEGPGGILIAQLRTVD